MDLCSFVSQPREVLESGTLRTIHPLGTASGSPRFTNKGLTSFQEMATFTLQSCTETRAHSVETGHTDLKITTST